ncbi:hypothetical protein PGT21_021850 [Puccinia graminis f. sp. tritici]|uniref:Uncharacterized protein n=1 Tax=Puccinia graminis f. sp. tritici TaxID=56615 RepID=A0A5B0MP88_PUCGR|nr:hypothetical protein PGT21_021850 [Puccinia graminis f. sp. tritici]
MTDCTQSELELHGQNLDEIVHYVQVCIELYSTRTIDNQEVVTDQEFDSTQNNKRPPLGPKRAYNYVNNQEAVTETPGELYASISTGKRFRSCVTSRLHADLISKLSSYQLTAPSTPLVDPISVKAFFPKSALIRFDQNTTLPITPLRFAFVFNNPSARSTVKESSYSIVQSDCANRYSNVTRPTKLSIPQTECAHSRRAKSYVTRCLAKICGRVNLTTSDRIDSFQKLTTWCSYLARTFSCLHHSACGAASNTVSQAIDPTQLN